MKYYLISGEPSGDLHGANLMHALRLHDPNAEFRCWGGDRMQEEGGTLVKHIRDLSFMGFVEVLRNLRVILRNLSQCKQDILRFQPDVVILIDFPGFNLRISKFCFQHHIRNVYYISPQVWAWKKNRIKSMRKTIDQLFVILPFEQPFYKQHQMDVHYEGNPLLDEIVRQRSHLNSEAFRSRNHLDPLKPIVAILPGSRKQEISKMLPIQAQIAAQYPDLLFVIAGVNHFPESFYRQYCSADIPIVYNQTYSLLDSSTSALVTSGTATLETALFNVPQVVCYKANPISYHIARYVANVKYISLVNLIADKPVVEELIQDRCCVEEISRAFHDIHFDAAHRSALQEEYHALQSLLGTAGVSNRIARKIVFPNS